MPGLLVTIDNSSYPTGTKLNSVSQRINTNGTTVITPSDAYLADIVISVAAIGVLTSLVLQDGQGTPLKLMPSLSTTALSGQPMVFSVPRPIPMAGGIKIITSGGTPADLHVWCNYYQ